MKLSERDAERFWTKVDRSGDCWLWTAALTAAGYGSFRLGGRARPASYAHRLAYEIAGGEIPEGHHIDHRCHNRRCVRPEHLRAVTPSQNNQNYAGARSDSGSGARGVSRRGGKWQVVVKRNGKRHYGGVYVALDDADAAARALRNRLFTHNERDRV